MRDDESEVTEALRVALGGEMSSPPASQVERSVRTLMARAATMDSPVDVRTGQRVGPRPVVGKARMWAIPAAVTAAAVLIVGIATYVSRSRATSSVQEFATAVGQPLRITLRDGTALTLGPATHLQVPADFGRATRTVTLDGEADFTVVPDIRHPFVVRTARAITTDIGTRFSVDAYRYDSTARISVMEGAVAVAPTGPSMAEGAVTLHASDRATINSAAQVTLERRARVQEDFAWAERRIVLSDVPLRVVLNELSHWYDGPFVVGDSALAGRHVTIAVEATSLAHVLDGIALVAGARYERVGGHVVFYPEHR